jgi:enolase
MAEIKKLEAKEILDSRGNPTLAVTATLSDVLYPAFCRTAFRE